MKTLESILGQAPVYLHNWKTKIDLISDFEEIYRLINGKMGQDDYSGNEFASELKEFLGIV